MLIAAGSDLRRINGNGAISMSPDGQRWSEPVDPFDTAGMAVGIARGTDMTIAINSYGSISSSRDLVTWGPSRIGDGSFAPLAISNRLSGGSPDLWMICGQKKFMDPDGPYARDDETGQIFRNLTGDQGDWELIYSHQITDSRFYGISNLQIDGVDTWVACGSAAGRAMVLYSINDGFTWSSAVLPGSILIPAAYDAVVAEGQVWISCKDRVISCPESQLRASAPAWDSSATARPTYASADLIKLAANSFGHLAAAGSGGIYYTTDRITWQWFETPGYRFRSIYWHEEGQAWYAGADSNLMRYTLWTSKDTIIWVPSNNLVQALDFCQY